MSLPPLTDTEGSYASSDEGGGALPQWSKRHSLTVSGRDSSLEDEGPERTTFPTLEQVHTLTNPLSHVVWPQVFRSLSPHIGFNIEVKYPVPDTESDAKCFPYFERNMMADLILHVVYRHARRRKIIFSSFDADMCTM